jgi:hypothetical protein
LAELPEAIAAGHAAAAATLAACDYAVLRSPRTRPDHRVTIALALGRPHLVWAGPEAAAERLGQLEIELWAGSTRWWSTFCPSA